MFPCTPQSNNILKPLPSSCEVIPLNEGVVFTTVNTVFAALRNMMYMFDDRFLVPVLFSISMSVLCATFSC